MSNEDRYIPGVPCWVDTIQPDPQAAAAFYRDLFGWEHDDATPPGVPGRYWIARLPGGDAAAIAAPPSGAPPQPAWRTYVWVTDADATAVEVRAAGGSVLREPDDIGEAGRTAVCADPAGAAFSLWQPGAHRGAAAVNEPGAVNFNDLHTRDLEGARSFYGTVFGWELLDVGGGSVWALPGYGDFLERRQPGMRESMAQMGAPERFEDVVASASQMGEDQPGVAAHWGVTFGVADADAVAQRAAALGARVDVAPSCAPRVRRTARR